MAKKPKNVERSQPRRMIPAWIWMIVGSLMTLMIGVLLYLWNPFKQTNTPTPQDGLVTSQNTTNQADNNQSANASLPVNGTDNAENTNKDKQQAQSSKKQDFEFYDILPEQQPTPVPDNIEVIEEQQTQPASGSVDVSLEPIKDKKKPKKKKSEATSANTDETYDGGEVIEDDAIANIIKEKSDTATTENSNTDDTADKATADAVSSTETSENNSDNANADNAEKDTETTVSSSSNNSSNKNENNNNTEAPTTSGTDDDPIENIVAEEKKPTYILQINSFGSAEEADKRRAEVLLAGIDSRVVKTKIGEGSFLYQVISREYKNKENVFLAQKRLQTSGIDSIVVERKEK